MDTQYDINDVGGIIQSNEIRENTEATNQRETTWNNDNSTEKMAIANDEAPNKNRESVFQAPNKTRKSVFQGTTNENRKSVFQGITNENRKSGKGKEIIEKSMNQEQKRKSTAIPGDLKDKIPRKSK